MAKKVQVPKQVRILASDVVAAMPELVELAEKGHTVVSFDQFMEEPNYHGPIHDFDLILSDSACAFVPGLEKWLPDAIKGARTRRYGNKVGLDTEV